MINYEEKEVIEDYSRVVVDQILEGDVYLYKDCINGLYICYNYDCHNKINGRSRDGEGILKLMFN